VHGRKGGGLDERGFVSGSRETWERLAACVSEARSHGITTIRAEDLKRMHEDYRQAAADLAYAQTHFPGSETAAYLNRLVGQAHGELYGATPRRLSSLWRFLSVGYPRLVRRNWRPIAVAGGILFGAVAIGYLLAYVNYPLARLFLPEAFRNVGDPAERGLGANQDLVAMIAPALSAFITVNNIQVALVSFAGGMTFGALTAYSMFSNGMMLGVLGGVAGKSGDILGFWSLIVPHGALELPAIVLAGGGGLMLARALLFPGDLPRGEALRRVSGPAVRVVLGTVPLFIIAGLVEGFFTPRAIDPALKLGLGVVLAVGLALYLGLAGRKGEEAATG
jgi:uncharacterized membrane protein SpoIIM required for sporulation